jgi:DNA-binding NtrC family response regulator
VKGCLVESDARVLVVDDEADMCSFLCAALHRAGYAADCAYSGMEALAKLAAERFDLALVDIRMPGMSGLELLRQIKERDPDTIVITMTAYCFLNNAIAAVRYGAYDYLVKPFDRGAAAVIDAVRRGLADRVVVGAAAVE